MRGACVEGKQVVLHPKPLRWFPVLPPSATVLLFITGSLTCVFTNHLDCTVPPKLPRILHVLR